MSNAMNPQPTVVRTSRGLCIAGTRITLYSIMDYLKAGCSPQLIRDRFNLTDTQMADVMDYIAMHRTEVEEEYHLVLQHAEDVRHYWDSRNRERLAAIAALPPKPGQEALRAKLQAWKAKQGLA